MIRSKHRRMDDLDEHGSHIEELIIPARKRRLDDADATTKTDESNPIPDGNVPANDARLRRHNNKRLRDTSDPFALPEPEFQRMFRLSRTAARDLFDELKANNLSLCRLYSNAIPFHLRFLATLNFLAHGSNQLPTANNRFFAQSQSSLSGSVRLVCDQLFKLSGRHIHYPQTDVEVAAAKAEFVSVLGMPDCCSVLDRMSVKLLPPSCHQNGYLYINEQSQQHSLNVLLACSASGRIVFADANYPGSVYESEAWQQCALRRLQEKMKRRRPDKSNYIVANSSFPADNGILTPVPETCTGSKEEAYNTAHRAACMVNRQTVVEMRQRWHCLGKRLHYTPKMTALIVYAAVILHNVCVHRGIALNGGKEVAPGVNNDDIENSGDHILENNEDGCNDEADVDDIRNEYISNYF